MIYYGGKKAKWKHNIDKTSSNCWCNWHWGSGPHSEGEKAPMDKDMWNTPVEQSRQPLTYWSLESMSLGGPRWHRSSWQRGIAESGSSWLSTSWQTYLQIWCEICHACNKPAIWKGAHRCGCCPCTCTLIKNPIMIWWYDDIESMLKQHCFFTIARISSPTWKKIRAKIRAFFAKIRAIFTKF